MRPLRSRTSITLAIAAASLAFSLAASSFVGACTSGSTNSLNGGPPNGDDGTEAGIADGSSLVEDGALDAVADVGIDTGPPLNSVDAADIPEGGAKVSPGVVACVGIETCNAFAGAQCCPGNDDGGGACIASSLMCGPGGSLACDESADCIVGTACCGSAAFADDAGAYLSTKCATSCAAQHTPPIQLCRTNGECGDAGPCLFETCSDGNTYELCSGAAGSRPDGGAASDASSEDGGDAGQYDGGAPFTCTPQ
jgi:hypothetical protein